MKYLDSATKQLTIDKRLEKPAWTLGDIVEPIIYGLIFSGLIFLIGLWLINLN